MSDSTNQEVLRMTEPVYGTNACSHLAKEPAKRSSRSNPESPQGQRIQETGKQDKEGHRKCLRISEWIREGNKVTHS